ncbi:uncharacterized protein RHO25_008311 [Cercospora beticola]|uniref:Uncharacterized protein n=1 Tax=Cercospora beticola TaxID=122368 RepID=A0ABZ0NVZ5_CERBT|nr:hypothetical protein RHO25_008311 [Cercospora beticola]
MKYFTLSALLAIAANTATASPINAIDPFLLEQAIEYSLAKRNAEAIGDNHVNFDKTPSLIEPWWNLPHMLIDHQKANNNKRNLKSILHEDNFLDGPGVAPWLRNMGCPKGSVWSQEEYTCTSSQKKNRRDAEPQNFLPYMPTIVFPEGW